MCSILLYEDEKGPVAAKTHGWYLVVINTGKDGVGSKDKRTIKCV
ncbi:MAG TPA: hypothetical protein VN703_09160 [Candidatus Sulfopaludibacter sp.]|nr:hypothetical protein [Candidatus Sulfopaludibacter sp.]